VNRTVAPFARVGSGLFGVSGGLKWPRAAGPFLAATQELTQAINDFRKVWHENAHPFVWREEAYIVLLSQGTRSRPSGLCESMRATKRDAKTGSARVRGTKKFHSASETSKTWAWPVVAITWDKGISLGGSVECAEANSEILSLTYWNRH
jgi:hypothetical protein